MEFAERLSVPLRWWVQGTMLVATLWLALVVAVPLTLAWVVTGLAMAVLVLLFLLIRSPEMVWLAYVATALKFMLGAFFEPARSAAICGGSRQALPPSMRTIMTR